MRLCAAVVLLLAAAGCCEASLPDFRRVPTATAVLSSAGHNVTQLKGAPPHAALSLSYAAMHDVPATVFGCVLTPGFTWLMCTPVIRSNNSLRRHTVASYVFVGLCACLSVCLPLCP